MLKRTLLSISAAALISTSFAQSDGQNFDAAVVLVPGMTVERNGVIYGGDFSSDLLRPGDIIRTDLNEGHLFQILTSDGSAIVVNANSEIYMDGSKLNYDVFRVNRGSANVAGNVNSGYTMPAYFSQYTNLVNRNVANVAPSAWTPGYVPTQGGNSSYISPYANVVNTPSYGVYDPYGLAARSALGNFFMQPYNGTAYGNNVIISSPWWGY